MTEVRIRKVDDWVVDSLRRQARSTGQTLEGALRELLHREALRSKQEITKELHQMQDELRQKYGAFSDSTVLIREQRDKWG